MLRYSYGITSRQRSALRLTRWIRHCRLDAYLADTTGRQAMRRPSSLNGTPSLLRDISPTTWVWLASLLAFLVYFYLGAA